MSLELKMLALSVVLGLVQILLSAHSASLQVGYRWTATAREARPTLTGVAGRLERALRNFLETFPLFAAAVLLVQVTGRNGRMSAIGADRNRIDPPVSTLRCLDEAPPFCSHALAYFCSTGASRLSSNSPIEKGLTPVCLIKSQ